MATTYLKSEESVCNLNKRGQGKWLVLTYFVTEDITFKFGLFRPEHRVSLNITVTTHQFSTACTDSTDSISSLLCTGQKVIVYMMSLLMRRSHG